MDLDWPGLVATYNNGTNISTYLSSNYPDLSLDQIIEITYTIQAGSYVQIAKDNNLFMAKRAEAMLRKPLIDVLDSSNLILDCGTGELTSLVQLLRAYPLKSQILAYDGSLPRLIHGRAYAKEYADPCIQNIRLFCGDSTLIPIASKSIDCCMSIHAIEPNGCQVNQILKELSRVSKEWVVLVEPIYELADSSQRARMDSLGYAKGILRALSLYGLEIVYQYPLEHFSGNLLNKSHLIIARHLSVSTITRSPSYTCPVTNSCLSQFGPYLGGRNTPWSYPIFRNIPILKKGNGILTGPIYSFKASK